MQLENSLAYRLEELGSRLGHCKRCVILSALFFVGSWTLAVLLIAMPTSMVLIAFGTMVAVVASCLLIAHAIGYALRKTAKIRNQQDTHTSSANESQLTAQLPSYASPPARRTCCGKG